MTTYISIHQGDAWTFPAKWQVPVRTMGDCVITSLGYNVLVMSELVWQTSKCIFTKSEDNATCCLYWKTIPLPVSSTECLAQPHRAIIQGDEKHISSLSETAIRWKWSSGSVHQSPSPSDAVPRVPHRCGAVWRMVRRGWSSIKKMLTSTCSSQHPSSRTLKSRWVPRGTMAHRTKHLLQV